jgi:16S rRNA (guanine1207-N2)-methyltransferase
MTDHYFSADPSVPFETAPVRASVWGRELDLVSGSGVFSRGRLDIGTAVLFRETQPPVEGDVLLDLGCGYGVIALALALARPTATVWAVDVNERALALTRRNAEAHGVGDRLHAVTPGRVPDDVRLDAIWSNPPIRVGKQELHAMLLHWFARLAPTGSATMVVGKNLGADSLQRWLGEQGYPTQRLASHKSFRVLHSVRG